MPHGRQVELKSGLSHAKGLRVKASPQQMAVIRHITRKFGMKPAPYAKAWCVPRLRKADS